MPGPSANRRAHARLLAKGLGARMERAAGYSEIIDRRPLRVPAPL